MKLFCHPARREAKMRDPTVNFACSVRSRICNAARSVRDDREKVEL